MQAVRRWLEDRKETGDAWLVVVDNADDLTSGIKQVLSKGGQGTIIITSQDNKARTLVDGGCESLFVDTMSLLEAQTLLLRCLELDNSAASYNVKRDCDEVAEQLGHLALALDLAGAHIHEDDTGPTQALQRYLHRFVRHKESLLQNESFRSHTPSGKTVWAVWDMTLDKIDALVPCENRDNPNPGLPARLLFALLARFRGTVIQDKLFRLASTTVLETLDKLYDGVVELPTWLRKTLSVIEETKEWDGYIYERARDRCVQYSLLQRTGGEWPGVSMHGLVQWRATKYETEQPWEKWHLATVLAAYT